MSNNCGGPVQSALSKLGLLSGKNKILPTNVMSAVANSPRAIGQTFHSSSQSDAATTSPWGSIYSP